MSHRTAVEIWEPELRYLHERLESLARDMHRTGERQRHSISKALRAGCTPEEISIWSNVSLEIIWAIGNEEAQADAEPRRSQA
jgi:hypothetical protein